MKKFILVLIAVLGAYAMQAQNISPDFDYVPHRHAKPPKNTQKDSLLPYWCIDLNAMVGLLTQQLTFVNPAGYYNGLLNPNISSLKFENGMSYGFDAQLGYFFGPRRHFGIGAGLNYMYQHGDLTMDNFHIEYQSTDNFGNIFRQEITGEGGVKETLGVSNFNIPLVLKYKTRLTKKVGFTADAGVLFNLVESNTYKANTAFDYEAIYKYETINGVTTTVFDNSPVPGPTDLLITKSQYESQYPSANIQNYFNSLQSHGYNVGLGVKPYNNSGSVSFSGSVGLLLRPAISISLSEIVALNLGVYYLYQDFNHTAASNYHLTDKVGQYSSLLNTVTGSVNNSYGLNVGLRFTLGKVRHCAPPPPLPPVVEEEEVTPEPDKTVQVSPEPVHEDTTAEPEEPQEVSISTPILFDFNKTRISEASYAVLDEAIKEIGENSNTYLVIHGYTDNTGTAAANWLLSKERANAVKAYLHKKGVKTKLMKTVAHGAKSPVADNKTEEGRARNRRVVIKMKERKK